MLLGEVPQLPAHHDGHLGGSRGDDRGVARLQRHRADLPAHVARIEVRDVSAAADAAGVSGRTLYRYFPTKDDIIFDSPREWLAIFNSVVMDRQPGEPTRELFLRALTSVGAHIAEDRERIVQEFAILTAAPSLRARHGRSDAEWVDRYLGLLSADVDDDHQGQLSAAVCAMALVAAQNALIAVWATGPPELDLASMAMAAFEQIDCVWPAGSRAPHAGG